MARWTRFLPPGARRARCVIRNWCRSLRSQVAVLMYHRIAEVPCDPWELCVTPEHFNEQLEVIKAHCEVLSLGELMRALDRRRLPHRAAVLTFDDGYADNFLAAKPLLEQHGIPATIFVTSGALGSDREFWWDELERIFLHTGPLPETLTINDSQQPRQWNVGPDADSRQQVFHEVWDVLRTQPSGRRDHLLGEIARWAGQDRTARPTHRTLTVNEAQRLTASGLIEIGAHTLSHPALSAHDEAFQVREVIESRRALESLLDCSVLHFAYPYGDYSQKTVGIVREAGFAAACTTDEANVDRNATPWQLPRRKVNDWGGEEFERQLATMFRTP